MQYKLNICVLARAFIFLEEKKKNSEQTSSTVTLPKQILIFIPPKKNFFPQFSSLSITFWGPLISSNPAFRNSQLINLLPEADALEKMIIRRWVKRAFISNIY